jgi:diadenosine tetraphosphate (Ap4A) HIT family hydrolase
MAVDALSPYDPNNVFARILRGEIPNRTVYEDEWALAFEDINPVAPIHVLVIPKSPYVSLADFNAHATPDQIAGFWRAVSAVTTKLGLAKDGFRILSNAGFESGQEVPHMHVHIFAGKRLGPMLQTAPR